MGLTDSEHRAMLIYDNPIDGDQAVKILKGFTIESRGYAGYKSEMYDRIACNLREDIRCRRMNEQTYMSILNGTHYLFTHEPHYEYIHGTVPNAEFRNGYSDAWVSKALVSDENKK